MRSKLLNVLSYSTLALVSAGSLADTTVYLHRGADGEVSFSDTATPGAERIDLVVPPARSEPLDANARIEQMLTVADDLAVARQAREADRARQRERLARATPPTIATPNPPADRGFYYPYYPHQYPGHHRKPHPKRRDKHPTEPPVDERPVFRSRLNANR